MTTANGDAAGYQLAAGTIRDKPLDVLVLGGGMAGVAAALAAKRADNTVAIAETSNVLGGQGTAGGVAGFCGDSVRVNRDFAELIARLDAIGRIDPYDPNDDRRAYDLELCAFVLQEMVAERGIEILLHTAALDARLVDGRIAEVLLACGPTVIRARPKVVIDATGNCIVSTAVGLPTVGPGPRVQLPMSLYFTLWDTRRPVTPILPDGCPRWERDEDLPMTSLHPFASGKVEVKMKVVGFDAADGESLARAEIHARRQMMGLIYYLQTRGYRGRHAAFDGKPLDTFTLASVSRHIGQRQGRLIVGEYALTEQDTVRGRRFADAVAVGTYHHDYHWPDTEKRAGTGITTMVEPFHVPLRAMIAKGASNLLAPGRSMSGDMLAFSSYRVMATCAQTGFAAGKAAQLAAASGAALQDLVLPELQRTIEAEGQSLDLTDYGEYLRVLRHADEIAAPGAKPAVLALARGRNAATAALWAGKDAPAELRVACRRDGEWSPPATAATLPAALVSIAACRLADGRLAAVASHREGVSVLVSEDGERWSSAMTAGAADNVALAGAALTGAVAAGGGLAVSIVLDGRSRVLQLELAAASARLGDALPGVAPALPLADGSLLRSEGGRVVRWRAQDGAWRRQDDGPALALVDAALRGDGTIAAVARGRDGLQAVLLSPALAVERTMALGDAAADAPCRLIATSVGVAACVAVAGGIRVVEFPPERMTPAGGTAPSEKDLAGRPYHEHMHLVEP